MDDSWSGARRLVLRGAPTELERALDTLHVRCDVRGVREGDGEIEVVLAAPMTERCDALRGVSITALPDDLHGDWTGLEADRAVWVGPRIVVRPPWVERPADLPADAVELVVPRGSAFGSGEHDSTRAALVVLEALWPAEPPRCFCDVGTGSGILALYASARGARRILACDVDPSCVRAASALLPTDADVRLGGPGVFGAGVADVVAANLDDAELTAALPRITTLWSGSGVLVLSGLRGAAVERAVLEHLGRAPDRRVARGAFVALGFGP